MLCTPIYLCAPTIAPPCYNLPWKTVWVGEHLDMAKHKNVIEGWEGWTLYPNNKAVTRPLVVVVENQRRSNKNLLPLNVCSNLHWPKNWKVWPIKHHFFLLTFTQRMMSSTQNHSFVGMGLLEQNFFFKPYVSWCMCTMFTLSHFGLA